MSEHRVPGIEFGFLAELKRRNIFRVAAAYLGSAWFVVHVSTVLGESFERLHRMVPAIIAVLGAGLPLTLFGAWLFERSPHGVEPGRSIREMTARRLDGITITVLALAIVAMLFDRRVLHRPADESLLPVIGLIILVMLADRVIGHRASASMTAGTDKSRLGTQAAVASIAVLPFANLTNEPAKEYFGDGLAEELINVLARVPGLKIPARTSSFAYKGKSVDVRHIAHELGVETVLEGSVRSAGERIRVVAQLVNARTGFHVWSRSWDRRFEDLFAVQDELAGAIVGALGLSTGVSFLPSITQSPPTGDLEAYQLYLQGLSLRSRVGERNLTHAIELFERALARDPGFTSALVAAVAARVWLTAWGVVPYRSLPDAEREARQALAFDPHLAEAHAILADVNGKRGNWIEAEAEFSSALSSAQSRPVLRSWYAVQVPLAVGHGRRALEMTQEAYRQAPDDPGVLANLAIVQMILAQDSEACRCAALATDLGFSARVLLPVVESYAAFRAKRYAEAAERLLPHLDLGLGPKLNADVVRRVYAAIGDASLRPAVLKELRGLECAMNDAQIDLHREIHVLIWYSLLAGSDAAYEYANRLLDRSARSGEIGVPGVWGHLWSPELKAFREDSRFSVFAARLGMLDYWKRYGPPDGAVLHHDELRWM